MKMHRVFAYILLNLLICFPVLMKADPWTVETLPMVHLQNAQRYVCNPDGVLSQTATDSIDAICFRMEQTRGVQSVIAVVKRIEGGDAYEFGMQIGRRYGVGSKTQNTGLIVVLSTEDRSYYILTGFGLEGTLPDIICHRIEQKYMVPEFRQGNWDSAMLNGVKAISRYIDGDEELKAEISDADDLSDVINGLLVMGIIAFFIIFSMMSSARKCPKCGKRSLVVVAQTLLYTKGNYKYYRVVRRCKKCGYNETTTERCLRDDVAALNGAVIGSMFGNGRGGGGGFSGGSFGGGGFGGGGAGGRF